MKRYWASWILSLGILIFPACITDNQMKGPPPINRNTPVADAVRHAIEWGGETLGAVKQQILQRKQREKVAQVLQSLLVKDPDDWPTNNLVNAMNLYSFCRPKNPDVVFVALQQADKKMPRKLAWELAARFPSKNIANRIDQILTQALLEDNLESFLTPGLAKAVSQNELKESYSIMREGLMQNGHVNFARAMVNLNPRMAVSDFMAYLMKATPEELRQLHFEHVDVFTCLEIFNHLKRHPVSPGHEYFSQLFFYAVSRNSGLAEVARKLLVSYMPHYSTDIALKVLTLPPWAQIAYVDSFRENQNTVARLFLSELKQLSPRDAVLEEIDSVKN